MNILLIPHLPKYCTRGYQLAKHLSKDNRVHFILWNMPYPFTFVNILDNIKNSWRYNKYEMEGVVIHKIRRLPFFFPSINKWLFKKQINLIFKKYKINIIFSESFFNEVEPPLYLPLIYDMVDDHEAFIEIYGSKIYKLGCKILNVKKTIENQILKSRKVVAVSDLLLKSVKKYNKKVYKIPNGVPSYFLEHSTNVEKNSYGQHSIVYVSNFEKFSNLPEVISAVNQLRGKYKNIKLILIGRGVQVSGAKKLVKKWHLEQNVKFLGWLNHREIPEIVSRCQVALLTQEKNKVTDSAFPIKIIEYLALDKKIVSSNLNEIRKLKCPNIFIYKEENRVNSLIKCIELAFSSNFESGINKEIAKKYSWDKICNKLQKIIMEEI